MDPELSFPVAPGASTAVPCTNLLRQVHGIGDSCHWFERDEIWILWWTTSSPPYPLPPRPPNPERPAARRPAFAFATGPPLPGGIAGLWGSVNRAPRPCISDQMRISIRCVLPFTDILALPFGSRTEIAKDVIQAVILQRYCSADRGRKSQSAEFHQSGSCSAREANAFWPETEGPVFAR